MTQPDEFAKTWLAIEREQTKLRRPPGYSATFRWRGEWRIGCVQPLGRVPISLLNISKYVMSREVIEALSRHDPGRAIVMIDDDVEIVGPLNILSVSGGRARRMDPEQTRWAVENAPNIAWTNDAPEGARS